MRENIPLGCGEETQKYISFHCGGRWKKLWRTPHLIERESRRISPLAMKRRWKRISQLVKEEGERISHLAVRRIFWNIPHLVFILHCHSTKCSDSFSKIPGAFNKFPDFFAPAFRIVAWLSLLVNFKNAIWTWGHFRRMLCNKILF